MHQRFKIAFILLSFYCSAIGQNFEEYRTLRSQGPIPADFTVSSSEKFNRAKENLTEGDGKKSIKEAKHNFLLESNFLIAQVLSSGRVLFNDPISNYLGQILDTILIEEPDLRKKLRAYAVRSTIVNSFTTDDGIILVNIGLLAQLENEAQLAFILCHEIAHFTESHIINAYVENEKLKSGVTDYKRGSFDEDLLAKSRFSKDLEKEADKLGLQRFLKTRYATSSLLNVYEVMRYAHLPFDDIAFDKTFFDREFYKINNSYFLNKVRPVEARESEDRSQDSHPSPTERQQLLNRQLAQHQHRAGTDFLVSKEHFEQLRTVARFELSELYLKSNRPLLAIYNSFLLLRDFPENQFLEKNIGKALYMLSKFKTAGNFGQVHPGFSHIEGESQQLFHLFYRLKPDEFCVLATGYLWKLREQYPSDMDMANMSEDVLKDLMKRFYVPGMFSHTRPAPDRQLPDSTDVQGKYDRLKLKEKENPKLTMIKYAFVDLFENPAFDQLFSELERAEWGGKKEPVSLAALQKQTAEEFRYWKSHGFAVDADKVVIVSPTYAKLDLRKKQKHKFLRSESAKSKFIRQIKRTSEILNLELEILDQSVLDSTEANTFNDIVFLNEWVDQRFTQADMGMINQPVKALNDIIEKYDTEFFTWTGVINYRQSKPLMYFYLLYALIPPAIPFAIYYLARPNYDTYYYCITFDLKTGEPVLVNFSNYRKRDARDMINSSVYDSFWQMKRSPKAKG